jgi:signal transduction histidine kinase
MSDPREGPAPYPGERYGGNGSARALTDWRRFIDALPGVILEHLIPHQGPERILEVGGQLEQQLGVRPETVLANPRRLWARVHPVDRQRLLDLRLEAIEDGHGFEEEIRVRHADGEWRQVRVGTSAPSVVPEGLLLRTIAMDITAAHQLDYAHWEAQRREAMGRLATGIAHSFNNMLAVILPNLELLQTAVPQSVAALATDARQAATMAAELVRQVATLARRDGPPFEDLFDVVEVVTELVHICRGTFDRAITITVDPMSGPIWVLGRRGEFLQVLLNLALNARDALADTVDPQLTLTVTSDAGLVTIAVTDNGEGMSDEVQRHIGQPFFSTRSPRRSAGLGIPANLSMLREIQGTLTWTSAEGQGSRFEVRLPTRLVSPALRIVRPDDESTAQVPILIIDDEELVRTSLRRQLERLGHTVFDVALGSAGLDLLAAHPEVRLVIVDLVMPKMSGQEVLRRIRTDRPDLPVVVTSGFIPEDFAPGPHTRVLFKPFLLDDLRTVLAMLLR